MKFTKLVDNLVKNLVEYETAYGLEGLESFLLSYLKTRRRASKALKNLKVRRTIELQNIFG